MTLDMINASINSLYGALNYLSLRPEFGGPRRPVLQVRDKRKEVEKRINQLEFIRKICNEE